VEQPHGAVSHRADIENVEMFTFQRRRQRPRLGGRRVGDFYVIGSQGFTSGEIFRTVSPAPEFYVGRAVEKAS